MKQLARWIFIGISSLLIGCQGDSMIIGREALLEVVSTSVVDSHAEVPLLDEDVAVDTIYKGNPSRNTANDPQILYTAIQEVEAYVVTSKYYYRLYAGDVIYRNDTWYRVIKDINLQFGANEDNSAVSVVNIGSSAFGWTDNSGVAWMKYTGEAIDEGEFVCVYTILYNDASGESTEVSRSKLYCNKNSHPEITDELPKAGDKWTIGTADYEYTTPPSLPAYTDTDYYEPLPVLSYSFSPVGTTNDTRPFNNEAAVRAVVPSPMEYTIKVLEPFNGFSFAGVVATHVSWEVQDATGTKVVEGSSDIDGIIGDGVFDEQYPTTFGQKFDTKYPKDYRIKVIITNNLADVELGVFAVNKVVQFGKTAKEFDVEPRSYKSMSADAFGFLEPTDKPVKRKISIVIFVEDEKRDDALDYLIFNLEQFVIFDPTHFMTGGTDSIGKMVRRGMITNATAKVNAKDVPSGHQPIKISFLEVV